ncbi:MAG TPA: hypothetical protein EYG16_11810 [Deltaproteobacteria bacterium]|nr:hypothetical protein [Candidatus Binatota bacterium]HIL14343.1 hypothetical protein [Deltaproteobacteria bacterium]
MRVFLRASGLSVFLALGLTCALALPPVATADSESSAGAAEKLDSAGASTLAADEAVKAYLLAMQEHRFGDAYDYVSSTLRAGKDRDAWAKEQKYIVELAEVKIFDFTVYPARVTGDKARVPNLLKSQDKFLNQLGLDEHELYDLIKEEGSWRIDQQLLVQGADRREYFPD